MEKDWLIRTSHNQILGPVTKDKIKNLLNENTLIGEDEICSGNGFWFKVKEKEFIEKYVFGDYIQGFDPIGEAENVLTAPSSDSPTTKMILIPIFALFLSTLFYTIPNSFAQPMGDEISKKKICRGIHH